MEIIRSKEFQGTRPWDALHVATLAGTSVRLHWTDQPYVWHINDGQEVFAVMDCQSASNTFHLSASNTFHFFSPLMLAFALFEPVRIVAGFQNVAVMRDTVQ